MYVCFKANRRSIYLSITASPQVLPVRSPDPSFLSRQAVCKGNPGPLMDKMMIPRNLIEYLRFPG